MSRRRSCELAGAYRTFLPKIWANDDEKANQSDISQIEEPLRSMYSRHGT